MSVPTSSTGTVPDPAFRLGIDGDLGEDASDVFEMQLDCEIIGRSHRDLHSGCLVRVERRDNAVSARIVTHGKT